MPAGGAAVTPDAFVDDTLRSPVASTTRTSDTAGASTAMGVASTTVTPRESSSSAATRARASVPRAVTRVASPPRAANVTAAFAAGPPAAISCRSAVAFSFGARAVRIVCTTSMVVNPTNRPAGAMRSGNQYDLADRRARLDRRVCGVGSRQLEALHERCPDSLGRVRESRGFALAQCALTLARTRAEPVDDGDATAGGIHLRRLAGRRAELHEPATGGEQVGHRLPERTADAVQRDGWQPALQRLADAIRPARLQIVDGQGGSEGTHPFDLRRAARESDCGRAESLGGLHEQRPQAARGRGHQHDVGRRVARDSRRNARGRRESRATRRPAR